MEEEKDEGKKKIHKGFASPTASFSMKIANNNKSPSSSLLTTKFDTLYDSHYHFIILSLLLSLLLLLL